MFSLSRRKVVTWLKWRYHKSCSTPKLLCLFLITTVTIFCCTWLTGSPELDNQDHLKRFTRTHNSSAHEKRKGFTVQEILNFPKDYHAKGVLSLPYGDIVEPFEAWYSTDNKMSRIDYYGGMDQTYQRENLGKYGFSCKIVPEFSETTQETFHGCLHRRGTQRFPVRAQSIVPTSHYFKYLGDTVLRGEKAAKWQHMFTIYNKVNTYILYTTKRRPIKPLRYEMMGYDTLLSSYYDHYVLDYELFEAWKYDYSVFQIPTDLDCFDFSKKKFANIVGELNPMLEFMPHTDNGAPFTFSHNSLPVETSPNSADNFDFASEGIDSVSENENEEPAEHDRRLASNGGKSLRTGVEPQSGENNVLYGTDSNYDYDLGKRKIPDSGSNIHPNSKSTNAGLYKQKYFRGSIIKNERERLRENNNIFPTHKQRSKKPKTFTKKHRKNHIYSWSGLQKPKQHDFVQTRHSSTVEEATTRTKQHKKLLKLKTSSKSKNIAEVLLKNYEDIVDALFESFKITHNKDYSNTHEHETRKDIYRHNLRFIMSRNRMHLGYKLRPNHLMDLTDNEIQKQKGLLHEEDEVFNGGIPFRAISGRIPQYIDWRKNGAVNSVPSQGICGSCYAYAVTGALEGAYFLKHRHLPNFSEQEIIDCSWGFGNRGCKGGYPYRAMQWILKHGGLATDNGYGKYLAQEGYCHFKNVSVGVIVESYMNISEGNVTELKQALSQYGPVSILINTQPKSFKFYSSGVYQDPECGTTHDHAALAVGYGVENGTPFWLIKNSWSKAWGDSGYIKISQRNNNCGVTSKAVVVKIK